MQLSALDDLDDPAARVLGGLGGARPLIAGVGKDFQNEGPHCTGALIEHEAGAVAILDIGGVDGDAQEEAEGIDKDVPLAAGDFLARVIALRIKRSPPFGAPLALWLSIMAAVGLASCPSCSRTAK